MSSVRPSVTSSRSRIPWQLLRRMDPTGQRAIANARQAAREIREAVFERRLLANRSRDGSDASAPHLIVLSRAECLELLAGRRLGRLAFLAPEGVPLVLPVNYVLDGRFVFIRSGPGAKLDAAERQKIVCFEVDDIDEVSRTGWSVMATGRAERLRRVPGGRRAGATRTPDLPPPWAPGPREHVIRVPLERVSGRRLLADGAAGGWEAQ